jgi:hypothetical protein
MVMPVVQPERIYVLHAGRESFPLAAKVMAVAAGRMLEDVPPLP